MFWLHFFFCGSLCKGYLHSAHSSWAVIAHLISNRSWREDIWHGECSWALAVATAVDVSISALYSMCLVRVVTCTAKKETTPPTHTFTQTQTHSQSSESQPSWTTVCLWWILKPLWNPPPCYAQRRTRSYCGLIQTENNVKHDDMKRTHTHTHTVLMDRQTEWTCTDKRVAPDRKWPETSERGWLLFLGRVCRDQRSTSRKKGTYKKKCFCPSVYRALREM